MAGISAYASRNVLDYLSGTASTPTRPTNWSVNVSLGVPSSVSNSEIATGSGISRQTVTFAAAASPAGSNSNINAMTWGPSSGSAAITGIFISDTTVTGGNMLYYGTLTTPRTVLAGDSLTVAAGNLVITLG